MISTKGRYALRVMIDLAEHPEDKYTPLKDIAERQAISKKYLEIIVKDLVAGGMLIGVSGKGGGYCLARKPEEYDQLVHDFLYSKKLSDLCGAGGNDAKK